MAVGSIGGSGWTRVSGSSAWRALVRGYGVLTGGAWRARGRVLAIGSWLVVSLVLVGLLAPRTSFGGHVVALELAGSSDRAQTVLSAALPASLDALRLAVRWDFLLVAAYLVILLFGLALFPARAYRLQGWRSFRHVARLIVVCAAGLDVVENLLLLSVTPSDEGSDALWIAVATAAWAKFLGLALVLAYVVNAVLVYALTPRSIQQLLVAADDLTVEAGDAPRSLAAADGRFRQGICIAGGGVRSAALALGGLQELEDPACPGRQAPQPVPSWDTAERVAAVSGGAYMAGAWSIARGARRSGAEKRELIIPSTTPTAPWAKGSPEEQHLLTRLGYLLAENPTGEADARRSDVPGVIVTYLFGVALNITALLTLWWLVVQPWAWLMQSSLVCGATTCGSLEHLLRPFTLYAAAGLVGVALWVGTGWVKALFRSGRPVFKGLDAVYEHGRWPVVGLLALAAAYFLLVLLVPLSRTVLPGATGWVFDHVGISAPISALATGLAAVRTSTRQAARLAPVLGGALFVLTVVLITVLFLDHAELGAADGWFGLRQGLVTWLVVLLVAAVFFTLVSPEWWSMAGFYRGKLRLAFATFRKDGVVEHYPNGNNTPGTAEPSLSDYLTRAAGPHGTPLRICTTATTSSRRVFTHYGIPALGVTLTPERVTLHVPLGDEGRWTEYSCSPADIESKIARPSGLRLTTMAAVAMSGAAISPAMGRYRIGPTRSLIALLNARLGVWIPNPKYVREMGSDSGAAPAHGGPRYGVRYPNRRIGYLLKEFLGVFDPDDLYLYLTDGGHWENTGLVELLREGMLDEVVCLDADTKASTLRQLADAIVLAKLEIGAEITIDLDELRRAPGTVARGADYARRSVAVGVVRAGGQCGLLWYAKPVLTAKTPADLLAYAETDPSFPSTSTMDQFFHTAQFTAYRDLGRYNARELVEARTALLDAVEESPDLTTLRVHSDEHWSIRSVLKLVEDEERYTCLRRALTKPLPDRSTSAGTAAGDPGSGGGAR